MDENSDESNADIDAAHEIDAAARTSEETPEHTPERE
jgi:hypothetical protein